MPYHYLDDVATADIAFEACGQSKEEMFIAAADALIKFDAGPASPISIASRRGFFKLNGSNWTGRPQPNLNKININVPIGSRWARGLRVSRF